MAVDWITLPAIPPGGFTENDSDISISYDANNTRDTRAATLRFYAPIAQDKHDFNFNSPDGEAEFVIYQFGERKMELSMSSPDSSLEGSDTAPPTTFFTDEWLSSNPLSYLNTTTAKIDFTSNTGDASKFYIQRTANGYGPDDPEDHPFRDYDMSDEISAEPFTLTVNVDSTSPWRIIGSAEWLGVPNEYVTAPFAQPKTDENGVDVTISVSSNNSGAERSASLRFVNKQGFEHTVEITQAAYNPPNIGPQAIITGPATCVFPGNTVTFDGSSSADTPQNELHLPLTYAWRTNFDNTTGTGSTFSITAPAINPANACSGTDESNSVFLIVKDSLDEESKEVELPFCLNAYHDVNCSNIGNTSTSYGGTATVQSSYSYAGGSNNCNLTPTIEWTPSGGSPTSHVNTYTRAQAGNPNAGVAAGISYTVTHNAGGFGANSATCTGSVTFGVASADPVITSFPDQTKTTTTNVVGNFMATCVASDPDGDNITYSISCSDGTTSSSPTVSVNINAPANVGDSNTVTCTCTATADSQPPASDTAGNTFTYTRAAPAVVYSASMTSTDSLTYGAGCDKADAVITNPSNQSGFNGQSYDFTNINPTYTPPSGCALTGSIVWTLDSGSAPRMGTFANSNVNVQVSATGVSVNAVSGSVEATWTDNTTKETGCTVTLSKTSETLGGNNGDTLTFTNPTVTTSSDCQFISGPTFTPDPLTGVASSPAAQVSASITGNSVKTNRTATIRYVHAAAPNYVEQDGCTSTLPANSSISGDIGTSYSFSPGTDVLNEIQPSSGCGFTLKSITPSVISGTWSATTPSEFVFEVTGTVSESITATITNTDSCSGLTAATKGSVWGSGRNNPFSFTGTPNKDFCAQWSAFNNANLRWLNSGAALGNLGATVTATGTFDSSGNPVFDNDNNTNRPVTAFGFGYQYNYGPSHSYPKDLRLEQRIFESDCGTLISTPVEANYEWNWFPNVFSPTVADVSWEGSNPSNPVVGTTRRIVVQYSTNIDSNYPSLTNPARISVSFQGGVSPNIDNTSNRCDVEVINSGWTESNGVWTSPIIQLPQGNNVLIPSTSYPVVRLKKVCEDNCIITPVVTIEFGASDEPQACQVSRTDSEVGNIWLLSDKIDCFQVTSVNAGLVANTPQDSTSNLTVRVFGDSGGEATWTYSGAEGFAGGGVAACTQANVNMISMNPATDTQTIPAAGQFTTATVMTIPDLNITSACGVQLNWEAETDDNESPITGLSQFQILVSKPNTQYTLNCVPDSGNSNCRVRRLAAGNFLATATNIASGSNSTGACWDRSYNGGVGYEVIHGTVTTVSDDDSTC